MQDKRDFHKKKELNKTSHTQGQYLGLLNNIKLGLLNNIKRKTALEGVFYLRDQTDTRW